MNILSRKIIDNINFMVKGKCISGENCNKNYCNNNGKCYSDLNSGYIFI